jgi:DNA mismatch repair protein MutS2
VKEESKQLELVNTKVKEKLESFQELYDSNQKLISIGKKFDTLSEKYMNNKQKKKLLDELMKMVMVENSKRKNVAPRKKKVEKAKVEKVLKEVEKNVEVIRERKKKAKAEARKAPPPKPKVTLKIGDRVRMIDGKAIGTIDTLEKNKAFVNYGMFTTNVSVTELEKV